MVKTSVREEDIRAISYNEEARFRAPSADIRGSFFGVIWIAIMWDGSAGALNMVTSINIWEGDIRAIDLECRSTFFVHFCRYNSLDFVL